MKIGIDGRTLEKSKTGVGRYLSNLLKFWKNDKDNKFYLYFKDEIPQDDFLKSDNFKLILLKNPFYFSSNFFFQHFLLSYHLKKDKIDFFFSPFYLKPFYCPTKSAIVLHDISYEAHPEWFDLKSQFILRMLSKYSAKTSSKIFTVSNYSKNEIIKYYKINSEKIAVTYLAPDNDFVKIDNEEKIKMLKEKYSLKGKFILSVGSIFNRRHILEIIEAFEKLALKYGDYQFLIIGKNRMHPFVDINEKIKSINRKLSKKAIIQLNYVSDEELMIFYNSCFLNIYLSDYEGFGLPIVESQFFGKPVITSYNSSLIEVGNDSVEFVNKNTVDEIYKSIEKIISDKSYTSYLIKKGNENLKRFSWERCAKGTLREISSV